MMNTSLKNSSTAVAQKQSESNSSSGVATLAMNQPGNLFWSSDADALILLTNMIFAKGRSTPIHRDYLVFSRTSFRKLATRKALSKTPLEGERG
jgi:hypothetical protein